MKKILITDEIRGMAKDYAMRLLNQEGAIDSLRHLKSQLTGNEAKYVERIIRNLPAILEMLPWNYTNFHQQHFALFDKGGARAIDFSHRILLSDDGGSPKEKAFYMHIVAALKYDVVQQKLFPECVRKMGIRACVYCNAQYAVSAKKGKTDRSSIYRSTYNIDHWKPKNHYPYLAVAFYNLYPCCTACNQGKSFTEKDWCMYAQVGDMLNPYKFRLDDMSLLNYLLTWDAEQLKIDFVDKTTGLIPDYDEDFHIQKLYNNFKTEVEDVIWRNRIYNAKMVEAMQQSGVYKIKPQDANRFIIGNYDREEDVMKRPLAKLTQDIARQLGLI